jgi:hypothetical protein
MDTGGARQPKVIEKAVAMGLALLLLAGSPVRAQAPAQAPRLKIVIVEGEGAINNLRQRVAREPVVRVEDENDRPVAGALVTFLLPSDGAGVVGPNGERVLTVVTNDQGEAVARGLQSNNTPGDFEIQVRASHQGQTATTSIKGSNLAAAAAAGVGVGKILAIVLIAAGAAAGGIVAATSGNGNGGPGPGSAPRPPTTLTPGSPSVGAP